MTDSLVSIDIGIDSQIINTVARVLIKVDNDTICDIEISRPQSIRIEKLLFTGDHRLEIYFYNKNSKESGSKDEEMSILIKHIRFQHIDKDFHFLSSYFPEYPPGFVADQKKQGKVWSESILSNHLGWNGKYVVEFQTPVYQWLHEKLNLGWLIR